MANVIKHKRGSGSDPSASNLVIGELAIRTDNGKLFTKMDSGAIAEIAGGGSDIAINTLSSSSATGGGSATFNGSAYRFTLSSPPSVSAAQLLVSINGVIQKPVAGTGQPSEGFSVDGNDIILGDAPATGSDFFILTFRSLGVSEPAANSVTNAKVASNAAIAGSKLNPVGLSSVGIGTTSPQSLLEVSGANNAVVGISLGQALNTLTSSRYIGITQQNNANNLGANSGFQGIEFGGPGSAAEGYLALHTHDNGVSSGERIRIDKSGNVGIGTNDPKSLLSISGANGTVTGISLGPASTAITTSRYIGLTDVNNNANLGTNSGFQGIEFGGPGSANEGYLAFHTHDAGVQSSECLRMDKSGNIGIGTTNPDAPLVVRGSASAPHTVFRVNSQSESTKAFIQTVQDSDIRIGSSSNHPLNLYTNGNAYLHISNDGDVGIGTTSPGGNRLKVQLTDDNSDAFVVKGGSGQGRTNIAVHAGNTDGASSTSYRLCNSSGTTIGSFFIMNNLDDLNIMNQSAGGEIIFHTSTTANSLGSVHRARFNMSGDFLLGKSSSDVNNTGVELKQNGQSKFTRNSGSTAIFNRNTNNGTCITFGRSGNVAGSVSVTTTTATFNSGSSDRSLKKNFENWTENTLDLFKNINPQKFNYIIEEDGAEKTKGYIAQDIVGSFPEAYPKDDNDKYMFNPGGMVVYLMKAIQELTAKVEALEAK